MDLKEQSQLGEDATGHWYYLSKGRAILAMLGPTTAKHLLDLGAGSGIFSRQLLQAGVTDRATCLDTGYPDELLAASDEPGLSFVRSTASRDFDLVLMIDVLEHVDDDVSFVRQYTKGLPGGTRVMVTVPAFRFLWSGHDDHLGHKRRYTRMHLRRVLSAAGLSIVDCRYFFAFILPVVMVRRLLGRILARITWSTTTSDLRRHSKLSNWLMTLLHDIERKLFFPFSYAGGLTVMCLARVSDVVNQGETPSTY